MASPAPAQSVVKPEPELLNLYDLFIGMLCVMSLTIMALQFLMPANAPAQDVFTIMDLLLCCIFMADFVGRLWRAHPKRKYLFWQGIFDFLGSVPFGALRIFRIFRLFRVVRVLRIGGPKRILHEFVERRAESVLYITIILALTLLTIGAWLVLFFESKNPDANIKNGGDAIWYSIVTITTVGYGDRFPVTMGGRLVGVSIMITGIGIFGVITSFMANAFMSPTKKMKEAAEKAAEEAKAREEAAQLAALKVRDEIEVMHQEMNEMRALLRERLGDGGKQGSGQAQ